MRPILLALLAAATLAGCSRGGASPLPANQPTAFNDADVGFLQTMILHHQQVHHHGQAGQRPDPAT